MKKTILQRILSIIIALSLMFSLTGCALSDDGTLSSSDTGSRFESGRKIESGSVKVVDLQGTWYEMGRQYGSLLSGELTEVYNFVAEQMNASDSNNETVDSIASLQKQQNPYYITQFILGASETSGLTVEQLDLVNVVERIAGLPQCSAAAAWGDYASDKLVIGRNYDYGEDFLKLNNDVVVTIYHPADGSLATATVGYAGEMYAVNGINEKGIFLELNNGTPSTNVESPDLRITGTTLLFDVLFQADSMDFMDLFFNTVQCSSSYIINVADSETVHSYEWCPTGLERGDGLLPDGEFVSTNHYVSPNWTFAVPSDANSWQSITRRSNLISLCEKNKGSIDADRMMEIIETKVEDGGAMNDLTVYQMVVEPESLTLWLKITNSSDWTKIDLASFMGN